MNNINNSNTTGILGFIAVVTIVGMLVIALLKRQKSSNKETQTEVIVAELVE